MSYCTIADEKLDPKTLEAAYNKAKDNFRKDDFSDLDLIFRIACKYKKLFPKLNLSKDQHSPEHYIERWVESYHDATNKLPSTRPAKPKSSCDDPAVKTIIMVAKKCGETEAVAGQSTHNLFMSAENVQGNLLEEYIASKTRNYGLLWCAGNILRSVDFCSVDESLFLQVKNRDNTENSSSSNIRQGTSIKKWYRLGTSKVQGKKCPKYGWEELNALINGNVGNTLPPCSMSEEDYQEFLRNSAQTNPRLITDK